MSKDVASKRPRLIQPKFQISAKQLNKIVNEASVNIPENKIKRAAYDLALLSSGLIDKDTFNGRWVDVQLDDESLLCKAEEITRNHSFQQFIEVKKLDNAQKLAIKTLTTTMEKGNCTPSQAKDLADALLKVQESARHISQHSLKLSRQITYKYGGITVATPIGENTFYPKQASELLPVINGMCCTSQEQIYSIVQTLSECSEHGFILGGFSLEW